MISRAGRQRLLDTVTLTDLAPGEVWVVKRYFADYHTDYVVDPSPQFDYAEVFASNVVSVNWQRVRF